MNSRRSYWLITLLVVVASQAIASGASAQLPPGLMFVGLKEGQWRLHVVDARGRVSVVATDTEPRTPAYSVSQRRIAYVASDGTLREIELDKSREQPLLRASPEGTFTQPAYVPGSTELFIVMLHQGNSVDTDIARIDRAAGTALPLVRKRSAQFEPAPASDGRRLYYSHVACTMECGKILQELWVHDRTTGIAEQLTLLNAIARQPAVAEDGALYFASNRLGHYHIWRLAPGAAAPEPLTEGAVVDTYPAPAKGGVYFVRRTQSGVKLMHRRPTGELEVLPLPAGIEDIRDLRFGN
jgi:Tol biopolymer transport system component